MLCMMNLTLAQENTLEDENAGFQDKHIVLKKEPKVKDLEQSKNITAKPPKGMENTKRSLLGQHHR